MPERRLIQQIIVLVTLLVFTSCNGLELTSQELSPDWPVSTPGLHNIDETKLDAMLSYIAEQKLPITAVLIVQEGSLVMEAYPQTYAGADVKRKLYSATKSLTSALIGIAIWDAFSEE